MSAEISIIRECSVRAPGFAGCSIILFGGGGGGGRERRAVTRPSIAASGQWDRDAGCCVYARARMRAHATHQRARAYATHSSCALAVRKRKGAGGALVLSMHSPYLSTMLFGVWAYWFIGLWSHAEYGWYTHVRSAGD